MSDDDTLKREIERRIHEASHYEKNADISCAAAVAVALEMVNTEREAHLGCHGINDNKCIAAAVLAERARIENSTPSGASKFLHWVADRLLRIEDISMYTDYIIALRRVANAICKPPCCGETGCTEHLPRGRCPRCGSTAPQGFHSPCDRKARRHSWHTQPAKAHN